MKTLLSLILVIFISVTTEALVCHVCESHLKKNCVPLKSETCPENVTRCYTNLMMEKIGLLTLYQSSRGCRKSKDMCITNVNMTMGLPEIYSMTKCCEADNCNTDQLKIVIPEDLKENGVDCPSCFQKGKNCTSEKIYKCKGTQDHCFNFTGGFSNENGFNDWTFKGCTTKEVCDYSETHSEYDIRFLKKGSKIQCSKK